MKYVLMGFVTLASSLAVNAQQANVDGQQQPQRNTYQTAYDKADCKNAKAAASETGASASSALDFCSGLEKIAKVAGGGQSVSGGDTYKSSDSRFNCTMKAGYTVDFKNCKSAVNLYNGVLLAEKAMQMQQSVRTDLNNKKISEKASAQAASGDSQGAAFTAAVESTGNVEQMYKEQAMMYGAAVAALSSQVATWKKQSPETLQKSVCTQNASDTGCNKEVTAAFGQAKTEIFANDAAKSGLILAVADYTMKAAKAAKSAMDAHQQGKNLTNAAQTITDEDADLMLEMCAINPTHASCVTGGTRTLNHATSTGNFGSFGDGGSNAFNLDGTSSEFGEAGAAGSEMQNVASVSSPFNDDIKNANGILNPAPAAAVTPGSGAAGGGGGGVGGGMGGGSASLGGDLNGEDKSKGDPEVKSGKGGTYSSAGGGKFSAVARGTASDDANPFASLFDQKDAGGGVEEAGDIGSASDGPGSGLFQKISKRYGQVQADKRIEANNLE